jgi:hypothetical protein
LRARNGASIFEAALAHAFLHENCLRALAADSKRNHEDFQQLFLPVFAQQAKPTSQPSHTSTCHDWDWWEREVKKAILLREWQHDKLMERLH